MPIAAKEVPSGLQSTSAVALALGQPQAKNWHPSSYRLDWHKELRCPQSPWSALASIQFVQAKSLALQLELKAEKLLL